MGQVPAQERSDGEKVGRSLVAGESLPALETWSLCGLVLPSVGANERLYMPRNAVLTSSKILLI